MGIDMVNEKRLLDFRGWLEGDSGQAVLSTVAKVVSKRIALGNLPPSALGLSDSTTESPSDVITAIQSELVVLILENRSGICGKLQVPGANHGRILAGYFLKYLLDKARSSPRGEMYHYLYKRSADTLRKSPGVYLKVRKNRKKQKVGTLYSLRKESREIGPLAEEDLGQIPLPWDEVTVISFEKISREKTLVPLAAHFWQGVCLLFKNRPVWVELRDFTRWVSRFVAMKAQETAYVDDRATGAEEGVPPVTFHPEHPLGSVGYPSEFDPALVRRWAAVFSSQLTEKEKRVYYLRYIERLPLKTVAAQMGFNTPSGPANHVDAIVEKLKAFAAELPWLSDDGPIEASRLARDFFMETLDEILKKSLTMP